LFSQSSWDEKVWMYNTHIILQYWNANWPGEYLLLHSILAIII